MLRKLDEKTTAASPVERVAMNLTRRSEYEAARFQLSFSSPVELGEATLEHQVKGGHVVGVPGYSEQRRMAGFGGKEAGDLLFAQVVALQISLGRPSLVVLRSTAPESCRHIASQPPCVMLFHRHSTEHHGDSRSVRVRAWAEASS